jgi:hypothetical protein
MSTADPSPAAHAPAWVQYCPRNFGEGDEESVASLVAEILDPGFNDAYLDDEGRCNFAVGVHSGAYYCRSWTEELMVFSGDKCEAHGIYSWKPY